MSRPAQVQKMADEAKALQEKLVAEQTAPVEPVEPKLPEQVTPPEEPPVTITKDEYDRLEQRYRTLQGMHSADNARYRGEMAARDGAIKTLEDRLMAVEMQSAYSPTAPGKYVTADDTEAYGETLDMVRRAAKEEAEAIAVEREAALYKHINDLRAELNTVQAIVPRVNEITQQSQEQVKAGFWGTIDTYVPNWRTINVDQGFQNWLMTADPVTGATTQQFLAQAQQNLDAQRVVAIFKAWEREAAGGQTPAPKTRAQTELERQVAPPVSKGTGPGNKPAPKIWTSADITDFYKKCAVGTLARGSDERNKLEADLFAAQAEGRVKP